MLQKIWQYHVWYRKSQAILLRTSKIEQLIKSVKTEKTQIMR